MKSRTRIRRRPDSDGGRDGDLPSAEQQQQRRQRQNSPGTTPASRMSGHRRPNYLPDDEEKRGTSHAPSKTYCLLNGIDGAGMNMRQPHTYKSRRRQGRKRAHLMSVGNDDDKSFSPVGTGRSHRHHSCRASALPLAAAFIAVAIISSPGILASAAELESSVASSQNDDGAAAASSQRPLRQKDSSSSSVRAGNLRRKADVINSRQGTKDRRLSRVFTDGSTLNGFDFDASLLADAPKKESLDDDPVLAVLTSEMGRPQDEMDQAQTQKEDADAVYKSDPTLAALLDADNQHQHHASTSSTPLTDALTASSSTVQARIVGGDITSPPPNLRYPYMVSLQRRDYPICGAFLIAPDCILTAAHCRGSFDYAELGRWNLAADATESYQRFDIVQCTMHPGFTYFENRQIGDDFMVCKLNGKADVDKYPPVKLNPDPSVPRDAEPVTVVGWGRLESGGSRSDQQRQATVNIVPNNQCRQAQGCIAPGQCYGYQNIIKTNMLCAQADGRDSCQGDSGGPLLVPGDKDDGSDDTIVGIVSFGVGCAEELFPGIYARISSGYTWIAAETERLSDYGVETSDPTSSPSQDPTGQPSSSPSATPSAVPSSTPTSQESARPSRFPTMTPSSPPSSTGSAPPSISSPPTYLYMPSSSPTMSASPTLSSQQPSSAPSTSNAPSSIPSSIPTIKNEDDEIEPSFIEASNDRWRRRRYRPGTVSITRDDGQPLGGTSDGTAPKATEWFTCPQEDVLQAREAECDPAQVTVCSYKQYCWNSCTQQSYVADTFTSTCRASLRKFERIPTMMCPHFACWKPDQDSPDGDDLSGRIADNPVTEEKPETTVRANLKFFMDRNRQRQHEDNYGDASR